MASQPVSRDAVTLGSARPFGEDLLAADAQHLGVPFDGSKGRCFLFGGRSHVQGDAAFDEEIYVHGCQVVWSAGRQVRKRFTTEAPVLQVAWCGFQGEGEALVMLQAGALAAYSPAGELQTVPLPAGFTAMWALPQGLLLTGGAGVPPSVLPHPLEELQAAAVEGGAWQGEAVVWASREQPFLATYSARAARDPGERAVQGLARVALWSVRYGGAGAAPAAPAAVAARAGAERALGGALPRTPHAAGSPTPRAGLLNKRFESVH